MTDSANPRSMSRFAVASGKSTISPYCALMLGPAIDVNKRTCIISPHRRGRGDSPPSYAHSSLVLRMDQRLNSLVQNQATINALIRAESNMPSLSEELTKPLHVTPATINDPVVAEITEHKRTGAGANLRHKVARDDGTAKQRIRLTLRQARLPDVAALVVLQLPERQDGRVISQPHGTTTVRTP